MAYKLCPKCGLNYIKEDEDCCSVCKGGFAIKSKNKTRANTINYDLEKKDKARIICNVWTGKYGRIKNNIAHEWISFIKADDGNYYIWLNDNGVYNYNQVPTIIFIKPEETYLYKVVAIAKNCYPLEGSNKKRYDDISSFNIQSGLGISYSAYGKTLNLSDIFDYEKAQFATFKTQSIKFYDNLYITMDKSKVTDNILYLPFSPSRKMRVYCQDEISTYFDNIVNINNLPLFEKTLEQFIEETLSNGMLKNTDLEKITALKLKDKFIK